MSTTFVYMLEEQVQAAYERFRTSQNNFLPGIACGFDDGDVFHVYTSVPRVHIAGYPCHSAIQFLVKMPEPEESLAIVTKIGETMFGNNPKPVVIVLLAAEEKRLEHRVFIRISGQFREGSLKFIPEQSELYSRSKGLLETSILANCRVGVVGLGSGGSTVALELAKAGVGNFVLIDFDRMELANISRHICGIGDLGRYKTKAVRDLLYARNPYIKVKTAEININTNLEETNSLLKNCDLIIAATDNDRSRFNLNQIALQYKIPTIFGRAITRAAGGDVLRVRPYQGPCLACIFTNDFLKSLPDEISQFGQARNQNLAYVSDEEVKATIQVGLSCDILPISNMIVKLALVELSGGCKASGLVSLAEDLVADFYIWANRRELSYANYLKMGYGSKTPSILRWYGAKYDRDLSCFMCGDQPQSFLFEDNIFAG